MSAADSRLPLSGAIRAWRLNPGFRTLLGISVQPCSMRSRLCGGHGIQQRNFGILTA